MSVLRTFVVLGFLVFFTSEFGFADPTYGKVGGSVVLNPGQTSDPITSVTWKHRTDLALEWFGGEITCYRTFEGRCDLDETTGSFTIRNLTPEDSGEYTPEINNRVLGKKELKFIKPVPKPTVSMDCNKEKTVCNLTCAADITSEFGPVTYEWKTGDTGEKVFSTNEELILTTKNEESSFSCSLKNPVSNSASDEFLNPIIRGNTAVIVLVALLLVFVVIAVIGAFFMNRAGHLPFLDKLFPCNNKAWSGQRLAALLEDDEAEAASDTRQDDAVHVMVPLLSTKNETNQDQAAKTPNGGLQEGNGKPDDSTCAPSDDTQPKQEIISKGKEALNGNLIDNTNTNRNESNPDPSAATPELNSQTDDAAEAASDTRQDVNEAGPLLTTENETDLDQAAETPNGGLHKGNENNSNVKETLSGDQLANKNEDGIDKDTETSDSMEQQQDPPTGEPVQNSRSEEQEPTTEEPENKSIGKEALSGDQLANTNEDGIDKGNETAVGSMEQQQDPPTEQVSDDKGEPRQNSTSEEQELTADGSDTSPLESDSKEMFDTDLAES